MTIQVIQILLNSCWNDESTAMLSQLERLFKNKNRSEASLGSFGIMVGSYRVVVQVAELRH